MCVKDSTNVKVTQYLLLLATSTDRRNTLSLR